MRHIRVLLFAALLLPSAALTAGQMTDAFLAPGDPPLTRERAAGIIDLFEFSLAAKFTQTQRIDFIRALAAQWRDEANAPKTYAKLLEVYGQVRQLQGEQLRAAQAQFQAALLAEVDKNPRHERNRILSDVYRNAHPGIQDRAVTEAESAGSQSQQPPDVPPSPAAGDVPGELVGRWMTGNSSDLTFTNRTTGASTNASGIQVLYTIRPDGRYEYATLETHTMYNCQTRLSLYKSGHVEIDGATITFIPEGGKFTSEDDCNRQYNYTKPAELKRETYRWSVTRDESGEKICLQGNGINGCAYKR